MIATTQRSGSTLLAMQLWRTGGMGAPLEYLRKGNVETLAERIGVTDPGGYWRGLQSLRTSPNGVFGFKAFASQIKDCGRSMPEVLSTCLPPDRIVYLEREDKDRQAISLARATRTDEWTSAATPAVVRFERSLIDGCRRYIDRQEIAWFRYFDRVKLTPVRVTYEALVENPESMILPIAATMGVDLTHCVPVELPELRKQGDDSSEDWVRILRDSVRTDTPAEDAP